MSIDQSVEDFIKPYRQHVNQNLDSILAYAVETYSKKDGEFNTAIGNMMADAVYEQIQSYFQKKELERDIDFCIAQPWRHKKPLFPKAMSPREQLMRSCPLRILPWSQH